MRKLMLPLLALLLFISCEKESQTDLLSEDQIDESGYVDGSVTLRSPAPKIDVCHYDDETGSWNVINISANAWPAHAGHGDVQLIDNDGDGWVTAENECGYPVDCDDNDPQKTESCCDGGEVDSNGPLFVAPDDEPGLYTWQEAIAVCDAKDLGGYTWFLPSKEELLDVHGGLDLECFAEGVYWSSTDSDGEKAFGVHFNTIYDGTPNAILYSVPGPCRCVHR